MAQAHRCAGSRAYTPYPGQYALEDNFRERLNARSTNGLIEWFSTFNDDVGLPNLAISDVKQIDTRVLRTNTTLVSFTSQPDYCSNMNSPIIHKRTQLQLVPALLAMMFFVGSGLGLTAQAGPRVTVFAAASLKNALDDVAANFEQTQRTKGTSLSISYAGSSALARQIQYGAPAQIFISANSLWMDLLEDQAVLEPATRIDLAGNQLVLIAGPDNDVSLEVEPGMDLITALQGKRLAMALVEAVPAGIYGRQALISLGVWETLHSHIAQTDNVRAALRLVALGEAPLGIVYATDAATEPRVRVVGIFPPGSHPPIIYPAALLRDGNTSASQAFFRFLTGSEAQAIFRQHGFTPAGAPPT